MRADNVVPIHQTRGPVSQTGAQQTKRKKSAIDLPFLVMVLLLSMMGLVMVFSASHAAAYYRFKDSYYFIRSQALWVALGLVVLFITAKLATPKLMKVMAMPSLAIAIGLLALVPFIGVTLNDAKRWLKFGPITIQPSELAKVAVVLAFAYMITRSGDKIRTFRYGILPYACILLVIGGLLAKQPHISATVLIFAIGAAMLLVGGVPLGWFVAAIGAAVPLLFLVIRMTGHGMSRIELWLNPYADPLGKGYQTIQSLYAVGSGGLFGLGLGKSRQKYLYIPEPQNDFIFAIVCEELGFIGAMIIILLFVALVWRGFVIAFRAPDRFSALVVVGIMVKVGLQTMLNIAVVTNTIPNTGVSLPFFSSGGSAMVVQLFEMGLVLAISRYSRTEKV